MLILSLSQWLNSAGTLTRGGGTRDVQKPNFGSVFKNRTEAKRSNPKFQVFSPSLTYRMLRVECRFQTYNQNCSLKLLTVIISTVAYPGT